MAFGELVFEIFKSAFVVNATLTHAAETETDRSPCRYAPVAKAHIHSIMPDLIRRNARVPLHV